MKLVFSTLAICLALATQAQAITGTSDSRSQARSSTPAPKPTTNGRTTSNRVTPANSNSTASDTQGSSDKRTYLGLDEKGSVKLVTLTIQKTKNSDGSFDVSWEFNPEDFGANMAGVVSCEDCKKAHGGLDRLSVNDLKNLDKLVQEKMLALVNDMNKKKKHQTPKDDVIAADDSPCDQKLSVDTDSIKQLRMTQKQRSALSKFTDCLITNFKNIRKEKGKDDAQAFLDGHRDALLDMLKQPGVSSFDANRALVAMGKNDNLLLRQFAVEIYDEAALTYQKQAQDQFLTAMQFAQSKDFMRSQAALNKARAAISNMANFQSQGFYTNLELDNYNFSYSPLPGQQTLLDYSPSMLELKLSGEISCYQQRVSALIGGISQPNCTTSIFQTPDIAGLTGNSALNPAVNGYMRGADRSGYQLPPFATDPNFLKLLMGLQSGQQNLPGTTIPQNNGTFTGGNPIVDPSMAGRSSNRG